MIGNVIAHFILPYEYNTKEKIQDWITRNVGTDGPYRITWETVGTIGDRELVREDGHNHVYIPSPEEDYLK